MASVSDIPIRGNQSTVLLSTQEQVISRADQERPNDSVLSLREGDLEFASWESSGDLFDGHPDLVDGLADAKLDEVFEELLN